MLRTILIECISKEKYQDTLILMGGIRNWFGEHDIGVEAGKMVSELVQMKTY